MADDKPVLPVVIDSLALALVASSDAPILLSRRARWRWFAASDSFSRAFQIEPATSPWIVAV
jgi:hypothetical protein